jgi:guanine deaminase
MKILLRGRILTFHADPVETDDNHRYIEDGALVVDGGIIVGVGDYSELADPALPVIDHRPHLMMPGFIDPHIHFPQVQVIASWGKQLLDWLNGYVFPEETRFADPAHAARMAEMFLDLLLAHGTTTACAFASVHPGSVDALFSASEARGMRMIAGKVMMDRNAPDGLRDTPQRSYDETKALIARWGGKGRLQYAITPRFAITSTPEQMEAARALASEHLDLHIQTHLSENLAEIEYTLSLYPKVRDYLDVYETYGLLGPKSLMGHAIHLRPREIARMAETGTRAVFCPTSNLFLGSGLFDAEGLRRAGVISAVATDVGAGTHYSQLQTLNEAYKVLQLRGQALHPLAAFHWATRGNARALGLADRIGSLEISAEADLVVLNSRATPAMALRAERIESIAEELFLLQILGDDRAVVETYVAGAPMKRKETPAAASSRP